MDNSLDLDFSESSDEEVKQEPSSIEEDSDTEEEKVFQVSDSSEVDIEPELESESNPDESSSSEEEKTTRPVRRVIKKKKAQYSSDSYDDDDDNGTDYGVPERKSNHRNYKNEINDLMKGFKYQVDYLLKEYRDIKRRYGKLSESEANEVIERYNNAFDTFENLVNDRYDKGLNLGQNVYGLVGKYDRFVKNQENRITKFL